MKAPGTVDLPLGSVWQRLALACVSGAMLGASFPPSPIYSLAYVALIPFLLLLETLQGTWSVLRYSYLTFFVFHLLTLSWIGGFVVGKDVWMAIAGAAVLVIHPLFYVVVILIFTWVRRRLGLVLGLTCLPFVWVSYEYSHSLSEVSFPWITLGNSQAYDLQRIQIAEFTSVYGISFLILCFNIVGFVLITKLATRSWTFRSRSTVTCLLWLVLIYFGPWVYGKVRMNQYESSRTTNSLRVGVVQPNIDPWEKWGSTNANRWASYDQQLAQLVLATKSLGSQNPEMTVWPETAIPFRILLPANQSSLQWLRANLDSVHATVLTGLPYTVYYDSANAPATASQSSLKNLYYDDFNSTALFIPGQGVGPVYKKIVLVPFAERIPYAETFKFLIAPLQWNVGIGMWGKGRDTIVFSLPRRNGSSVKFASVICYESIYPNFVREFVKRGAQFLVIMTNDSWWGNTPGVYQHASYASIRAVENRRWIVRAANGGISGLVDPAGIFHYETTLYTAATFDGTIELADKLTFYTRHGDVFALVCVCGTALFLVITFIPKRKPTDQS